MDLTLSKTADQKTMAFRISTFKAAKGWLFHMTLYCPHAWKDYLKTMNGSEKGEENETSSSSKNSSDTFIVKAKSKTRPRRRSSDPMDKAHEKLLETLSEDKESNNKKAAIRDRQARGSRSEIRVTPTWKIDRMMKMGFQLPINRPQIAAHYVLVDSMVDIRKTRFQSALFYFNMIEAFEGFKKILQRLLGKSDEEERPDVDLLKELLSSIPPDEYYEYETSAPIENDVIGSLKDVLNVGTQKQKSETVGRNRSQGIAQIVPRSPGPSLAFDTSPEPSIDFDPSSRIKVDSTLSSSADEENAEDELLQAKDLLKVKKSKRHIAFKKSIADISEEKIVELLDNGFTVIAKSGQDAKYFEGLFELQKMTDWIPFYEVAIIDNRDEKSEITILLLVWWQLHFQSQSYPQDQLFDLTNRFSVFISKFCSGRFFSRQVHLFLLSALIGKPWSILNKERASLKFEKPVVLGALWKAIFYALHGSDYKLRSDCLRDITSVFLATPENSGTIYLQHHWAQWIYQSISDVLTAKRDKLEEFENAKKDPPKDVEVVLYALNISATCIFQAMQRLSRITPVFEDFLKSLKIGCGETPLSRYFAQRVLLTLLRKVYTAKQNQRLTASYDSIIWTNIYLLIRFIHKFVIHTPTWGDSSQGKETTSDNRGHAFSSFTNLTLAKKDLEDAATKLANDPFGLRTKQNSDGSLYIPDIVLLNELDAFLNSFMLPNGDLLAGKTPKYIKNVELIGTERANNENLMTLLYNISSMSTERKITKENIDSLLLQYLKRKPAVLESDTVEESNNATETKEEELSSSTFAY